MEKQGSNKGIYIFWFCVLLIVVAVCLFIFVPRVDYSLAFKNVENSKITIRQTENLHNMNDYAYYVLSLSFINGENKDIINSCIQFQNAFNLSRDRFVFTALTFINETDEYSELVKTQTTNYNLFVEAYNDVKSYYKTNETFIKSGGVNYDLDNTYAGTFAIKYRVMTKCYADLFNTSAQIINTSTQKGMVINDLTISVNNEMNKKAQELLSETNLNLTAAQKFSDITYSLFATNYYKNYLDKSVDVSYPAEAYEAI